MDIGENAVTVMDMEISLNVFYTTPVNTLGLPNAGSMLARRRRRWANIEPTLGQRNVFAGTFPRRWQLFSEETRPLFNVQTTILYGLNAMLEYQQLCQHCGSIVVECRVTGIWGVLTSL